jgi:CheY-like chemotaxis protein
MAVINKPLAQGRPNLRRSLLVVDDDFALTSQLTELFRHEGYLVTTAADGLDAARFLMAGEHPDLLLLDMHLEGIDGWELAAELRAMGQHIPILVITGDANPRRCAQEIGAEAYLAKPFDLVHLLGIVERLVGGDT